MRQHNLFWGSSYDRGLFHLLNMWEDIKKAYPDAELHITYGWQVFDMIAHNNPERMEWKKMMILLMDQPGITVHGRVNKKELKTLRQRCGIWAYPTDFTEINCITALECQHDGCVPVTIAYAALKETVGSGVMVQGDIYDKTTREKYKQELLSLMGDETRWKIESKKGKKFALKYSWENISSKWNQEFVKKDESVKVSIVTPTIRRGWWEIMSRNLRNQTYKNFEWIIVDDYPKDRSKLAKQYATKFGLDIKYLRGKPRKIKRTYGLVNANNTGYLASTGELIVILQDFILIPNDGIEQLVYVYKKNPNSLIAPVDVFHYPAVKPDITSEDWFGGKEPIGEFMKSNVRIRNEGMRKSTVAYEFEQNYGAIPKHILDDLGGWYEFIDEGLGFDNTDIAYRAMKKGYSLIVDETNCCVGIDHWEALKGSPELGVGRERNLNNPRYIFIQLLVEDGSLPLKATQEISDSIELYYDMPEDVNPRKWIEENDQEIALKWATDYKLKHKK
jgi:glycosyltransferase involved in cell wall biosynthesis